MLLDAGSTVEAIRLRGAPDGMVRRGVVVVVVVVVVSEPPCAADTLHLQGRPAATDFRLGRSLSPMLG